jgi:transcription initiation factor TFIIIB Brf1 subunit/transcription initiation factor TFIIB
MRCRECGSHKIGFDSLYECSYCRDCGRLFEEIQFA